MNLLDHQIVYSISMTCFHSLWQGILILGVVTWLKNWISPTKTLKIYWIYMGGLGAMLVTWISTFIYFLDVSTIPQASIWYDATSIPEIAVLGKLKANNPVFYFVAYSWILGALIFLIRAYFANQRLSNKKKTAFKAPNQWQQLVHDLSRSLDLKIKVLLKHSGRIKIPLVIGIFQPIILMPTAYFTHLTPVQLEAILMHELTHIKRHDYLANTIQIVIESLLFYHPVSWFIGKKIRQYREYICDEQVQSNVDTIPYLEALYRIADFSNSNPLPAVTLYNQKNELIMRVKRMLNKPFSDYRIKPFVYVMIIVIIAFSQFAFKDIQQASLIDDDAPSSVNLPLPGQVDLNQSIDPVLSSFENLKKPLTRFESQFNASVTGDTVPEKIEELNKRIEAVSRELEQMSEHISQEIESKMGAKMKELELKSQQLERELEPKMKAMEEAMNSLDIKEFGQRQLEMESRLEESMIKLEERMGSEEFQQLEKKIEFKSQQLEALEHDSNSNQKRQKSKKLQKEIQELSHKLQNQMRDIQMEHQKILNNPEIKELQEELRSQSLKMAEIQRKHQHELSEKTIQLNREMRELQLQMEVEMKTLNLDIRKNMELKNHELKSLHLELDKMMQSLKSIQ